MTTLNDEPAPRFKIGCLPVVGCVLVALVLFAAVALRVSTGRHQRAIEAELARLRASGRPATLAELSAWHAPPPGANDITEVWIAAIEPFDTPAYTNDAKGVAVVGEGAKIPLPGEPWPDRAEVELFLTKQQAVLDRLLDAAQREGIVRYPHKFEDGFSMLLPQVQKVRGAARLLILDANLQAHRGDAANVTRDLHAMFRAAVTLEHEPLWVSQLVRMAVVNMACHELAKLLPHVTLTPADLKLLQEDIAAARNRRPLQHANWGERLTGLTAFQDGGSVLGNDRPPAVLVQLTRGGDMVCYLDLMRGYDEAAELPWPESLAATNKVEQDLKVLAGNSRMKYPLTMMVMPALGQGLKAGARTEAQLATAETAMAIERYRLDHSKLPGQLADLVSKYQLQTPNDPYDGKPLRYVVQRRGYVVYSVGEDGKDDGGQCDDSLKPDVAFKRDEGGRMKDEG